MLRGAFPSPQEPTAAAAPNASGNYQHMIPLLTVHQFKIQHIFCVPTAGSKGPLVSFEDIGCAAAPASGGGVCHIGHRVPELQNDVGLACPSVSNKILSSR